MNSFKSIKSGLARFVLLLAMVFFSYSGIANAAISWGKQYSGVIFNRAPIIQPTADGGYIAAGMTLDNNYFQMQAMKLDATGNIIWQKVYSDGVGSMANYIQQTSDGGYILLGSNTQSSNAVILKLAADGIVQWQKSSNLSMAGAKTNTIHQTSDGGYILAGHILGDSAVIKLAANGEIQWQELFSGNPNVHSISESSDGGYLIAGWQLNGPWVVMKIAEDGTVIWQKSIADNLGGGLSSIGNNISSMQPTSDGGCILSGHSFSSSLYSQYYNWVYKLDSNGTIQWQKKINSSSRSGSLVLPTPDGGFLIGIRDSSLFLKFDKDGNKLWVKNVGFYYLESLQNTPDGGFVISSSGGQYNPVIRIDKFESSVAPPTGCGSGNGGVYDIEVNDLYSVANDISIPPRLNNSSTWDISLTVTDGALTTYSFCMSALPAISVTPASLDFSAIKLGNSSAKTVIVSNSGAADLTISGVVITGTNASEFVASSNCTNIVPNGSCSININFTPVLAGSKTATLSIASNDPLTPNKDVALSGIGVLPTFAISTSVIGGNGGISCDTTVNQGATSNCTISPDTGFHLATFADNTVDKLTSVIANAYSITNVTADHTIAGTFALDSHSVSFNSNGGSAVNSQSVVYNSTATVPTVPTRTGYTFAGWYNDAGLTTAFAFSTAITADTTLYAKWTINSYTVSFNSNCGRAVPSQSVAYNTTATAPSIPTRSGYTFVRWYSNSALTLSFSFTTPITNNITLYAKWTENDEEDDD